jgi:hypothetical protein
MGLESRIRQVIENEPACGLIFGTHYWFDNGLIIPNHMNAEKLMEILDESGEFGPTRLNFRGDDAIIEFGIHESCYKGGKSTLSEYAEYCNSFWSGEED